MIFNIEGIASRGVPGEAPGALKGEMTILIGRVIALKEDRGDGTVKALLEFGMTEDMIVLIPLMLVNKG